MANAIPKWAYSLVEHSDDWWENGGNIYFIRKAENSPFGVKWILRCVYSNGGWGRPFKSRKELEEYIERNNLRPQQQLTLSL